MLLQLSLKKLVSKSLAFMEPEDASASLFPESC